MEHKYTEQELPNFLVGISCMTYNHHDYIQDAMNGFTMQQTTFPFVAVIVDDASTDGEPEVIRNYLENHFDLSPESEARQWENEETRYIYARHKENKNCYFAVVFLKTNYYNQKKSKKIHTDQWLSDVKYIAWCEGDDYWTYPQKLQKQINILEKDSLITLVHTAFKCVDKDGNSIIRKQYEWYMKESKSGDVFAKLLERNYILTLTVCVKSEVLESEIYKQSPYNQDYNLFLSAAALGNIIYMEDATGCYRQSPNGLIMTNLDDVVYKNNKIRHYYFGCIFNNKIPKYNHLKNIKLKYRTAIYVCNQYKRYHNKQPFEDIKKENTIIYLYLLFCIISKVFHKICNVIW